MNQHHIATGNPETRLTELERLAGEMAAEIATLTSRFAAPDHAQTPPKEPETAVAAGGSRRRPI